MRTLFAAGYMLAAACAFAQGTGPLKHVQTIPLQGVEGRIDHLAVDVKGQRLFVAALGNNTLEVVDLRAGARTHSIRGLKEPQGVAFSPELNRIYVANGQGEGCDVFDGSSFAKQATIKLGDDSDNVRYDAASRQVVVGYGDGVLAFIDAASLKLQFTVALAAHPESFQLAPVGGIVYVNVPNRGQVSVVSRNAHTITASWPLSGARANFPMAIDAEHHRLVIGCRQPARALVMDLSGGKSVDSFDIPGDTDDLFVDGNHLYVIGGDGYVDSFAIENGRYRRIARVKTAPGARTGLLVPALHRLFIAVPHRGSQPAGILVFETAR